MMKLSVKYDTVRLHKHIITIYRQNKTHCVECAEVCNPLQNLEELVAVLQKVELSLWLQLQFNLLKYNEFGVFQMGYRNLEN